MSPSFWDPTQLSQVVATLGQGGVVVLPTETYYGLGTDPWNPSALDRLLAIKGRPAHQPILLLIRGREDLDRLVQRVPPLAEALMARFWPGPLTLVLPAREEVLTPLTGGTGRIGVRVPAHPLTRSLLQAWGGPLTGTSANLSGRAPVTRVEDLDPELLSRVDGVLCGGETPGEAPSTVLDVVEDPPRVLRPGKIPLAALQKIWKEIR